MAHIFKHPTTKTKGIVVFTHKEINWFFPKKSLKNILKPIKPNLLRSECYDRIRKNYFIGLHIGASPKLVNLSTNCDFYLVTKDVIQPNASILMIPLTSRNFTPKYFTSSDENKYWDILNISSIHKGKNLDLFMKSIKKIFEQGYNYKVLLITKEHATKLPYHYTSLMDDYYQLFSSEERTNFVIMQFSSQTIFPSISNKAMPFFYNSSKIFTLYSHAEGGSKTISEALCSGLPVVAKSNLFGGARDFLNESNSLLFDEYKHAHKTLIQAVENYDKFKTNPEKIKNFIGEEQSIIRIKEYFSTLYQKNNQKFDGDLINTDKLNVRLNSHLNENISWAIDKHHTADILTDKQFLTFIENLKFNFKGNVK